MQKPDIEAQMGMSDAEVLAVVDKFVDEADERGIKLTEDDRRDLKAAALNGRRERRRRLLAKHDSAPE